MTDKQREACAALMEYARLEAEWHEARSQPLAFRRLHKIPKGVLVDEWLAAVRNVALRMGAALEDTDGR